MISAIESVAAADTLLRSAITSDAPSLKSMTIGRPVIGAAACTRPVDCSRV